MVSDIDPRSQFYRQVLQFPEVQLLQLLEDLPRPAVPPMPNDEKHFWISWLSHFGHLAGPCRPIGSRTSNRLWQYLQRNSYMGMIIPL